MTAADLKIGMILTNDGKSAIPLYDTQDGTGDVILSIAPGQLIGRIVDFSTGPAGVTIAFTSQAIYDSGSKFEKMVDYIAELVPNFIFEANPALVANAVDVLANVSAAQVAAFQTAMDTAGANEASMKNAVVADLQKLGKAVESAVGWVPITILALFGIYILTKD